MAITRYTYESENYLLPYIREERDGKDITVYADIPGFGIRKLYTEITKLGSEGLLMRVRTRYNPYAKEGSLEEIRWREEVRRWR